MSNARSAIKIDIVKPIPPKNPIPIIFPHFKSEGKVQRPILTPINAKSQIPNGFPITRPYIIPKLLFCPNPFIKLFPIEMQVLASANRGRIRKATGLCKKC